MSMDTPGQALLAVNEVCVSSPFASGEACSWIEAAVSCLSTMTRKRIGGLVQGTGGGRASYPLSANQLRARRTGERAAPSVASKWSPAEWCTTSSKTGVAGASDSYFPMLYSGYAKCRAIADADLPIPAPG